MLVRKEEYKVVELSHAKDLYKHVILDDSALPNLLQFAKAVFNKGIKIEPHSHLTMSEVFYICKGRIKLELNNKVYFAESGETFYVKRNEKHSLIFLETTELLYFNLKDEN